MTYIFSLQLVDGTPAKPSSVRLAVPSMRPGDTIPLGRERTLRVLGVVAGAEDDERVLVVEEIRP